MEEKKGKGVSRRDFLKRVGAGSVGAAVISKGLLDTPGAEAYPTEQVGSSRVDLQACKLEYSIVSPK